MLNFVPVLLLNDLVRFFEAGAPVDNWRGITRFHPWVEVVLLGLTPLLVSLLQTRSMVIFQHLSIFVRTAVSTLLYEKSLCISAAGRAATSTGQVVNMMSNDTTQLQRFIQFGGMTMVAPLQIIVALALIYQQVGNATWVGVAFMVALAPVNVVVFSVVGKMRRKVLKYSDLRVKMMNEILAGIRIIKYYAWERPFAKEVGKIRDSELKALTNLAYVSAVGFSLILLSAPIIQPILVFLTYIKIQNDPLSAATAFTTVALFNIMRFPFAFMPMGMLQFIQSRISLRRLARYLELPELENYVISEPPPEDDSSNASPQQVGSITIKNASFAWTATGKKIGPIDDSAEKAKKKKEAKEAKEAKRRSSKAAPNAEDLRKSATAEQLQKMRKSTSVGSKLDDLGGTNHSSFDAEWGIDNHMTLRNITCTIEAGSLVGIVGTVGSGKSSFLSAVLGEMEAVDGAKVYIPRDETAKERKNSNFSSYCAQTPWVINDTLRGNILFGRRYNKERYEKVVEACALLDDLAVLPAGDKTEIGEKGINLSGGQKARVSLARAMYSEETRLLLLDDPLSAVDAHVGEHLFRRAITGEVSAGTTRLLVTHHVHFLPRCDKVIVLEDGKIKHCGKYFDLIEEGVDFAGSVNVTKGDEAPDPTTAEDDKASSSPADATAAAKKPELSQGGEKGVEDSGTDDKAKAAMKKRGQSLVQKEEREEGSVAGSAYVNYARAGGFCAFITMFLVQALGRASEIGASFWLAYWAESAIGASMAGTNLEDEKTAEFLNIYALLGMVSVFGLTIRSILMATHRLHASRSLHKNLLTRILRAPVSFFDVTPTGRILARFAADMDKIDLDLTQSIGQGMGTIFSVVGAIGAIVAGTKGTFLIALMPMSYFYYLIQKWFRRTSTELQRVTSISASPIFADFSQILSGTSTVRAYSEQSRFFRQCQSSFDKFNACYNVQQMCNYWLGLRLDLLGGFIGFFVGAIAVGTARYGFIPAGWLGLALSYSIEVTGFLKHGVRMIATVEADMNSVERVLYYSESIDTEAPDEVPDKDPAADSWPSKGQIDVDHASMRYRDGPLVLKDISISINGGEKVGVVGRTGSGKSSLMNLLFRITEAENDGGRILIDGVNTSEIGMATLRLNLSIIPQDPVMFSNTVRYNMDPFAEKSDEELWEVLKKVQLAEVIAMLPEGLDDQVAEGGENFSQGQRQLLCIARSLLRGNRILVMDEATASIDNKTDASIQKMIRENFGDCTVLTIAHRLGTILDSDRILVLDDGHVAEFDTPSALLAKKEGIFKAMVEKSKSSHSDSIEES
jgi:ATP-binding cassette subfamily C (CFTR/MRP) protein 1